MKIANCSKMYNLAKEALIGLDITTIEDAATFTKEELLKVPNVGEGTIRTISELAQSCVPDWSNSSLYKSIHPRSGKGYYYTVNPSVQKDNNANLCNVLRDNPDIGQVTIGMKGLQFTFDLCNSRVYVSEDGHGNKLALSFNKERTGCRFYLLEARCVA